MFRIVLLYSEKATKPACHYGSANGKNYEVNVKDGGIAVHVVFKYLNPAEKMAALYLKSYLFIPRNETRGVVSCSQIGRPILGIYKPLLDT
jgi:hypothetical protein